MNSAHRLVQVLSERKLTLCTAESCTGGGVATRITSVPGASACYLGSVVAYANQLKIHALGVPEQTIATHGAVSEPVAVAMARGGRERLLADYCISITGIAGPGGGSPEKPVGLVFIGIAGAAHAVVEELHFHGSRAEIQSQAIDHAIAMLLDFLNPGDV